MTHASPAPGPLPAPLTPATHPIARVVIGTRTSALALWQTHHVADRLHQAWPGLQCELHHVTTQGDRTLDRPLPQIGGKGLFTQELEDALRVGAIDLAVHSLKDLPVEDAPGLVLGAVLARADPRDALVARAPVTLQTLPPGAVVGTSSVRRQAQLLALRPDLQVRSIRGNVDTRIRKVMQGDYDAAVLAGAGLVRLGLTEHIVEWLPPEVMLPAPGQGALAVQCRAEDAAVRALLAAIAEPAVRGATSAERTFLAALGGGCSAPIAAAAHRLEPESAGWVLTGLVATPDGRRVVRVASTGVDAAELGRRLADEALAAGGAEIIAEFRKTTTKSVDIGVLRPLEGKRVLVTRAETQADDLAARLAALGAIPVLIPTIRLAPLADLETLDRALRELAAYDWIVFTSQNAVDIFLERCSRQGVRIANRSRIAAVGPKTAALLAAHGLAVELVPARATGEAVAHALGDVAGLRILLPRAAAGRPELPNLLRAGGALVDDVAIYDTVPSPPDEQAWRELARGVDVLTFTSGSTVRSFVDAVRADGRFTAVLEGSPVVCIGPVTAEAARACGLAVAAVPADYTVEGLTAVLCELFQPRVDRSDRSDPSNPSDQSGKRGTPNA